jgi:hypothetical protein
MIKFCRNIARVTAEETWLIWVAMVSQGLQKIFFISHSDRGRILELFELIFLHEPRSSVFNEFESGILDHRIWKDYLLSVFDQAA